MEREKGEKEKLGDLRGYSDRGWVGVLFNGCDRNIGDFGIFTGHIANTIIFSLGLIGKY